MPTDTDHAYLAGIIDGEGAIVIYKRPPRKNKGKTSGGDKTPRYEVILAVGMTDRKVIYWLKDNFPGSICEVKAVRPKAKRRMWKWSVTGSNASDILKKVMPYLKTKALQACLAIYMQDSLKRKKAWNGVPVDAGMIRERDRILKMNQMLNQGYDPEFMGGYYDR